MINKMLKKNVPKSKTISLNPVHLKKLNRPLYEISNTERVNNNSKFIIDCESTQNIKTKNEKIFDFLKSLNIENYFDIFINNGINTEEKIQILNYDILKLLKIPYVHCKRILTKIYEMKKENVIMNEKLKKNNSNYEEILLPKEEDEINEEEQRKTFYDAVSMFKQIHNDIIIKEEQNKENESIEIENNMNENNIIENGEYKENINNNLIKKKNDKSFSSSSKKKNDYNLKINISKKEVRQLFPLNKNKTLCHECLHMILQDHCIKKYNKLFCSLHCLEIFENKNITFCNNCKKKIEIVYAFPSIIYKLTYYCSNECLNKVEPNEFNNINKSQIIDFDNINNNNKSFCEENEPIDILDF